MAAYLDGYGLIPSEAVDQLSPRELAPSGSGPLISMPLPLIRLADRHGDCSADGRATRSDGRSQAKNRTVHACPGCGAAVECGMANGDADLLVL